MPDNYKKVNAQIFYYSNIEEITLGANTTQIENNAFIGSKIKSIFLPKTLTHVGSGILGSCENLEKIYVGATEEEVNNMIVTSNVDFNSETPQWHQTHPCVLWCRRADPRRSSASAQRKK